MSRITGLALLVVVFVAGWAGGHLSSVEAGDEDNAFVADDAEAAGDGDLADGAPEAGYGASLGAAGRLPVNACADADALEVELERALAECGAGSSR